MPSDQPITPSNHAVRDNDTPRTFDAEVHVVATAVAEPDDGAGGLRRGRGVGVDRYWADSGNGLRQLDHRKVRMWKGKVRVHGDCVDSDETGILKEDSVSRWVRWCRAGATGAVAR